ncbi:MAG: arsenate reductase [Flavobacteriales bacterium]|jgi:arsenate reductase
MSAVKKIYHLSNCSTCQRIIKELDLKQENCEFQDIKTNPISADDLDVLAQIAGSYENLFSRRAMKYRELGLGDKKLTEKDYKSYILGEYTFLQRPVIVIGSSIFIGSSKKTTALTMEALLHE